MNELFPIASGLVVGSALTLIRPQMRLWVGVAAAVVLGTLATIVSGEYKIGWEFLLIDIPLVAICAAAAFVTTRAMRRRIVGASSPG
jgi:hypothetical protein